MTVLSDLTEAIRAGNIEVIDLTRTPVRSDAGDQAAGAVW
jgi:hypothetical protein